MKLRHASVSCVLLAVLWATALLPVLAQPTRVFFLHHSCGQNLIEQGGVREGLTALGYEFYDHGYNDQGLRLADGSYTGANYDIPGDNTDPNGLAELFAQPLHDPPDNAFSQIMQYDVIAFKSCFPNSNIVDDYQLNEFKSYYLSIRDRIDQYPDKLFIVVTQPPQVPSQTNGQEGERARALANWLQSDEYLAGHPNIFVFDFFGYLAGDDNFLRAEYRIDEYDAHPNERANREIGPLFVAFLDGAIHSFQGEAPRPAPTPTSEGQVSPTATTAALAPTPEQGARPSTPTEGVIDDFESPVDHWHCSSDDGSSAAFASDASVFHGGAASLSLHYDVAPNTSGSCGQSYEEYHDWSGGTGLSLWMRADEGGLRVTVMVFAGNPEDPTPFEAHVEPSSAWAEHIISWAEMERAAWASEGGLPALDPTRVLGYAFGVESGASGYKGTLWVDDVGLYAGEAPEAAPTATATPAAPTSTPEPGATSTPQSPEKEPEVTPTSTPSAPKSSSGGVCRSAAVVLPMCAAAIVLGRRSMGKRARA